MTFRRRQSFAPGGLKKLEVNEVDRERHLPCAVIFTENLEYSFNHVGCPYPQARIENVVVES
jgi:hypothetical protein